MSKYEICPKCEKASVHIATSELVYEFYGDLDDDKGEASKYASECAPQNQMPEMYLFAHICFECGYLKDIGIERPGDYMAGVEQPTGLQSVSSGLDRMV